MGTVLLLGPALGPGALLSLDLVLTPRIPFPDAIIGLGTELPRRVPLGAPLSWASEAIGGPSAGKALLVLATTAAFAGATRLARDAAVAARLGAGALYALGPWAATRVGAGHWTVVATAAVLPWVLPRLLQPSRSPARTFLAAAALAATGVFGGVVGGLLVATGLLHERAGRRALPVIGLVALAQTPWLVPGLLLQGAGLQLADPSGFATRGEGPLGVAGALIAQHGFWRASSQVGGELGVGGTLVGLGVTVLAFVGARDLPRPWGPRLGTAAVVGFVVAAASNLPVLGPLHRFLVESTPLAPLRDSHRLLVVFLVWAAPAAALGVARLAPSAPAARQAGAAVLLAGGLALAAPGFGGVDGRLTPVEFPDGWAEVRRVVDREPGTALALPWHEYLDLSFAGGRRVLNPVADYLGGDVIWSHDPELGGPAQESVDPREDEAARLAAGFAQGRPGGRALSELGVRWVVMLDEVDAEPTARALDADPDLTPVVRGPAIRLYRVEPWTASSEPRSVWKPSIAVTAHAVWVAAVTVAWKRRAQA